MKIINKRPDLNNLARMSFSISEDEYNDIQEPDTPSRINLYRKDSGACVLAIEKNEYDKLVLTEKISKEGKKFFFVDFCALIYARYPDRTETISAVRKGWDNSRWWEFPKK